MFRAQVLLSSLNAAALHTDPNLNHRLTTMELEYPRCVHSEFMTHRMFSRNAASSRAIPIEKMLSKLVEDPFIPIEWGRNQPGMQALRQHTGEDINNCRYAWMTGLERALISARELMALGLHKQIVNRVCEPWQWITVLVTGNAVAWENFFHLRCSSMAEPHIREVAYMARDAYDDCPIKTLSPGQAHLPLVRDDDWEEHTTNVIKISTGRCARVSYLTHHGLREPVKDIELHDKLMTDGHWSPFEHPATANACRDELGGNLGPWWIQYRKMFSSEVCRKADRSPKPLGVQS